MKKLLATAALLCVLGIARAQVDCSGLDDGPHGEGCRSYTCCQGGQGIRIECDYGCVYSHAKGGCDDASNVGPPCGEMADCGKIPDGGSFPILSTNCEWYYTCIHGFLSKQGCTPGLKFSYFYGHCMRESDVYPPCGTRPLPTKIPPEYLLPSFITLPSDSFDDENDCDNFYCPRPNSTDITTASP